MSKFVRVKRFQLWDDFRLKVSPLLRLNGLRLSVAIGDDDAGGVRVWKHGVPFAPVEISADRTLGSYTHTLASWMDNYMLNCTWRSRSALFGLKQARCERQSCTPRMDTNSDSRVPKMI